MRQCATSTNFRTACLTAPCRSLNTAPLTLHVKWISIFCIVFITHLAKGNAGLAAFLVAVPSMATCLVCLTVRCLRSSFIR